MGNYCVMAVHCCTCYDFALQLSVGCRGILGHAMPCHAMPCHAESADWSLGGSSLRVPPLDRLIVVFVVIAIQCRRRCYLSSMLIHIVASLSPS